MVTYERSRFRDSKQSTGPCLAVAVLSWQRHEPVVHDPELTKLQYKLTLQDWRWSRC